jgi:hypothetical protein
MIAQLIGSAVSGEFLNQNNPGTDPVSGLSEIPVSLIN